MNWSELAFELQLDAIARQVVLDAVVESYDNDRLALGYPADMNVMLKPGIKEQIKQAIEARLGVSLAIEFNGRQSLEVETPRQADSRKQEELRQAAIRSIRQTPVVQQLNRLFAAELVEASVRKSDNEQQH